MKALTLCTTLLLTACAVSNSAQETATPAVASDSAERLIAEVPQGWVSGLKTETKKLRLIEYYPPDTQEVWTDKLSIEAMSGSGLPEPLEFVQGWASDQASICDEFADHGIFAGLENGYPTAVHLLECGRNKRSGKPIVTMTKVIQGNEALYTITRIWRLERQLEGQTGEAGSALPIDKAAIAAWSNTLKQVTVCDSSRVDHPCPR